MEIKIIVIIPTITTLIISIKNPHGQLQSSVKEFLTILIIGLITYTVIITYPLTCKGFLASWLKNEVFVPRWSNCLTVLINSLISGVVLIPLIPIVGITK